MLPVLGQAQTKGSSSGQQKDVIPFIDYQNLGNTQSRARTLASPANARVQGDFPDLCSGIYNLNFEDPKLVSGTDRQAGAVYTFQNVVTLPGNVIHARVTIESVVNGSVSLFDNTGDGFPSALQPSFLPEDNRASGQGFSIFNFEFLTGNYDVLNGQITEASAITIPAFNSYLVDIDGDSWVNEFQAVSGGGTVTFGQGATETIEALDDLAPFATRFQDKTQSSLDSEGLPIDVFHRMVRVEFTNIQSFKWKFGVNYASSITGHSPRLFSFYVLCIQGFLSAAGDYSDAPASYGSPNHAIPDSSNPTPRFGAIVDKEPGGIPTVDADGDDNDTSDASSVSGTNDEDGLSGQTGNFDTGSSKTVTVNTSGTGFVNGWIDWNRDGDFNDAGEQVIINSSVTGNPTNTDYQIQIPCDASTGISYLRIRINSTQNLGPTGGALNGEVEDYKITITDTNNYSPVTISSQPVGATYCQNTPSADISSLSVIATGSGTMSYQWYSNTSNSDTGGTLIPGATDSTYKPSAVNVGTTYYYVVITGNCKPATSNAVAVVVNQVTVMVISTQPTSNTYCINAEATDLTFAGSSTGTITYEWFSNATNSNADGTSVGTGAVYRPSTVLAGTTYYYAVATGASCESATSNAVTVTIQDAPDAGGNGTLTSCEGTSPTNGQLFASLQGTPDTGGTWSTPVNGVYTYTVAATAPCTVAATATVTVTIQNAPDAGANGTLTSCEGTIPTNGQLFASLQGTPDTGGTWSTPVNGVYTYTVAATAPCTVAASATVTVTFNSPTAPAVTVTDPTCEVATGTINFTRVTGVEYALTTNFGTLILGTSVTALAAGSTGTLYARTVNTTCVVSTPYTIGAQPEIPVVPVAGPEQEECALETIQTLTATAEVEAGTTLKWYDAEINGNVIADPSWNTVGTVTYWAEAVSELNCKSERVPIKLTINDCSLTIVKDVDIEAISTPTLLTYTIIVTNTGKVDLTDVSVSDELPGGSEAVLGTPTGDDTATGILNVGETWIYTVTYQATQADVNAGANLVNTAMVVTNETGEQEDTATTTISQDGSLTVTKTADQVSYDAVGDELSYDIVVTNTGNVTLTGVSVADPLTGLSETIATLLPGAANAVTFETGYTVTQGDLNAGRVDNTATAKATFGETELNGSDDETVFAGQTPGLSISKTSTTDPNMFTAVGDELSYDIVVTNTGNVTLTGVSVADPLTGLSETIATLLPGAANAVTFETGYTVTQGDLNAGRVDNTATAKATFGQTELNEIDDETVEAIQTPVLSIAKTADQDSYDAVGDVLTYQIVVTNTGNVALTDIVVSDPQATSTGGSPIATLAPGASATVTASYTVTQPDLDAGTFTNTATTTGTFGETELSDSDDETVIADQIPAIQLLKDGVFVDGNNDGFAQVGETVVYTFTVTNTGNVTLTDVTITDDKVTVVGDPLTSLAPGMSNSGTFTASYVLAQADIDKGVVLNLALTDGKGPKGKAVNATSTDPTSVDTPTDPECQTCTETVIPQNTNISIVKQADKTVISQIGEVINYTLTVTNTGNVTLMDVTVTDPLTGLGETVGTLLPGQIEVVLTSYTVTSSDIDKATLVNVATVKGTLPDRTTIEDDSSVSVGISPNEIITSDDDFGTRFISFGGILGNILENDRLNGVRPNDVDVDFEFTELDGVVGLLIDENGEISLIPGVNEAREYTLKYTLRELANPSNSDDAFLVFRLLNDEVDLSVTKTSFEAEIFEGDEFEYQITLANIGGTPATDVVLVDDLPNGVTYLNSRVESVSSTQIQVGTPAVTGTRITWNIPFLPADGVVVIRVSVQAGDAVTITNVANVSAEEEDTSALNNQGDDVNQILPFRIPNVITPNQDGDNDTFEVKGLDKFASNEIVIINRYGDHVFERTDYQNDWDAQGQVAGTYFYILTTVDKAGKSHKYKGWIQVINNED